MNDAFEDVIRRLQAQPEITGLKAELCTLTDIATRLLHGKPPTPVDQFILNAYAKRAA